MRDLDWNDCSAVESMPGRRSGAWTFKNSRTPVSVVFDNFQGGATIQEISEWFDIPEEEIVEVLRFVSRTLDAPAERATAELMHAHTV